MVKIMKRIIPLIIIISVFLSIFSILYMGTFRTKMVVAVSSLTTLKTMPIDVTPKERTLTVTNPLNSNQTDSASFKKKDLDVYIGKDISPFNQGTIEYETRIDKGYGGPASSHIALFTADGTSHLSSTIYTKDSLFGPNNYLLLQNDSSGRSQFEQKPLNQTIEYGKWYKIKLNINSTAISFYFDGRPITTWLRPADETYTNIRLDGESAAVSFKNMVIEKNNQFSNLFDDRNNLFYWKTVFGKLEVKQDSSGNTVVGLFPISYDTLLITPYREDSTVFYKYGASANLIKDIRFSNGSTIAFSIFKITQYRK